MRPKQSLPFILLLIFILVGCGTQRVATQVVRDIQRDTVYLSKTQYDSIYIYQDRLVDRARDTLYIRDKSIEYRYKILHDTVRLVQRDSIPYEVTIVETKEIVRPLTAYDRITRACFWMLILLLIYKLYRLCARYRK